MNLQSNRSSMALVACAISMTLAACSGSPGVAPERAATASARTAPDKANQPLLYVGNSNTGIIYVFSVKNGTYTLKYRKQDSNGPEGLHVDARGNLYVADQGIGTESSGIGDIAVYGPNDASPIRLIFPGYNVSDVVPTPNGSLFASNFGPDGYFGPGSVSAFGPTGDMAKRTTTIPNSFQALSIVRDAGNHDVFATYSTNDDKGHIARFVHGKPPAIDLGVTFDTPWGIAEDGSGNLLVAAGEAIDIFTQSGKAAGSFSVPGTAYRLAFNSDRSLLYVTNFVNFDVEIFSYPKGKMVGTIKNRDWSQYTWPDGVAFFPPPK
jgi:hypothetical protein